MVMASSMKGLTQNILSSHEERATEITKIKEQANTLRHEAVDMVKGFSISRDETSLQLRRELAQSFSDRKKDVTRLIHGFHDSRRESGEQFRKELAQGTKLLVQNEKKRKQQVETMLDTFQSSRNETGAEMRKNLAEGKAKMRLEVNETLADAKSLRRIMGTELKNDLGKDRDERKADVEGMRRGFQKAQAAVHADLKGASDTWKEMTSAIRHKTPGGKAGPEAQAKIPVGIPPSLEERLLSKINQHAGGITLSKVAKELGLTTIVLGKASNALQEQGKIRKEGNLYFMVTT